MKKQIKKNELYNYVNGVISSRNGEERAVSSAYWSAEVKPLLHDGFRLAMKDRGHEHLHETLLKAKLGLDELMHTFPKMGEYAFYSRQMQLSLSAQAHRALKDMEDSFNSAIVRQVADGQTDYPELEHFPPALRTAVYEAIGVYIELDGQAQRNSAGLQTLGKEARTVIQTAKSGKDGFEKLAALGFPLDNFKPKEEQLPAVQKFSVDTCLLVGDCTEK